MKIGIYCRVSSEEQKKKGISIYDQKQRGIEFCIENGHEYEVFSDAGYSGSIPLQDRPGLKSLFDKIYLEEINGIYVVDWDRISRKKADSFVIKDILIKNNIEINTAGGKVNFNDETSDLLNDIKILLAEHEIQRLKTRIKRSLERSIKEGRVNGGPMIAFGYTKGEDKKMIIEPDEAEVVRLIYKLSLGGSGTKVIANYLNESNIPTKRMRVGNAPLKVRGKKKNEFVWRDSTIHGILTNTLYYGDRKYKGKIFPSPSLKIVEKDEFLAVQSTLKNRKHFVNTRNKYFYLLKGLIYCPICESKFYGKKREDLSDNQYICSSQRNKGEFCGNRGINIDKLNDYVWNSVLTLPLDIRKSVNDFNDNKGYDYNGKIADKENQIVNLHEKVNRLLSLYESGNEMDEAFIKPRIDKLYKEISVEREKLRILKKTSKLLNSKEEIIDYLESQLSPVNKKNTSDKEKQEIIRSLVKFVGVLWHKQLKRHFIWIEFKLDRFTQIRLGKQAYYENKTFNWNFEDDGENTQFLFRRINATIINPKKVNLDKDFFAIRINDKGYMENNPFKQ